MSIKRFNWQIWAGFLLTFAGLLSFPFFFVLFPATRDFPWANLVLIAISLVLLFLGIKRAFKPDRSKKSKALASILATLSLAAVGLFLFSAFVLSRWLPESKGAPQVGQKVPDFSLADSSGKQVALAELLSTPIEGKQPKGVLLVFYRGYW
jgi:cadmium resistance protein CadD (predicted permease)